MSLFSSEPVPPTHNSSFDISSPPPGSFPAAWEGIPGDWEEVYRVAGSGDRREPPEELALSGTPGHAPLGSWWYLHAGSLEGL